MFSGTTVVAVLIQDNTIVCANSGDSRAILCSTNQAGVWYFTPLSRDHKPDELDEAARIKKSNGRIEQSRLMNQGSSVPQFFGPKRVWLKTKQAPGLAMTRSLGDLVAKTVGVTHEPEIKVFSNMLPSIDKVLVIASDGLWDRIPNDEVTRMIIPFFEKRDAEGAATRLMNEAADRWSRDQGMIDDITIIVAFLAVRPPEDKRV